MAERSDATGPIGLLVAAGASTRMGFPKGLALVEGEPFAARIVRTLRAGGCSRVLTVLGEPHADALQAVLAGSCDFARNPAPERGMSSSVIAGLKHPLARSAPAVVVALVDVPRVSAGTVARLIGEWNRGFALLVRPAFRGRRGHPYLVDRKLFATVVSANPLQSLRPLWSRVRAAIDVDVDDGAILENIDSADDLRRMGGLQPNAVPENSSRMPRGR